MLPRPRALALALAASLLACSSSEDETGSITSTTPAGGSGGASGTGGAAGQPAAGKGGEGQGGAGQGGAGQGGAAGGSSGNQPGGSAGSAGSAQGGAGQGGAGQGGQAGEAAGGSSGNQAGGSAGAGPGGGGQGGGGGMGGGGQGGAGQGGAGQGGAGQGGAGQGGAGQAGGSGKGGASGQSGGLVWPNDQSRAASDPWIAEHHDQITEMRPRVLALNFVNGRTNADMEGLYGKIFDALAEGSRYHGYQDPGAKPFLSYELARSVDLTDPVPPEGWPYKNSTRYPRKLPDSPGYWRFDYARLFGQEFADLYGFVDPNDPTRHLTLCELVEQGVVHEVWIYGDADVPDASAAEVLEHKQRYDEAGKKIDGSFDDCAGNGCFDAQDVPSCKVSLRIPWVNNTRGPGCLVSSLSHGVEGMARGAIPYFQSQFRHFGNFDFGARFGVPFSSWYDVCPYGPSCLVYDGQDSVIYDGNGQKGSFSPLAQGCGNVHFPPNARGQYDTDGPDQVLSTCEHYGLGDGPGGADLATPYTAQKGHQYDDVAPDCESGWLVYWRQSFPGRGNQAKGNDGLPMKNWWPFLYY